MALNVQFNKVFNRLIEQYIVTPRLVNQQTLEYNRLCDYLADGSTVTATDVSAVMKQLEKKLPFLLGLNVKAICSPEGLTFRPTISGSITQSELKAKLEARKVAETDPEKAAAIDVNRELETSDLTTSDITASISIDLPKKWLERFHAEAEFKRITKDSAEASTEPYGGGSNDTGSNGSNESGSNSSGTTTTMAAPTFSGATQFTESTQVTISAENGAEIRYTTDGSTPTASSTLYSTVITLTDTTTVKAIAIKDGVSSPVASQTYTKGSSDGGDGMDG